MRWSGRHLRQNHRREDEERAGGECQRQRIAVPDDRRDRGGDERRLGGGHACLTPHEGDEGERGRDDGGEEDDGHELRREARCRLHRRERRGGQSDHEHLHAGEGGRFGDEEETIARGVAMANGVDISGPHPADTLFLAAREGKYDVVLAMYHDQALIPVKTLDFAHSVNVTIGLPYLRVSVDHGTAFDIAGKGIADAAPMRYAIEWAARHAETFAK